MGVRKVNIFNPVQMPDIQREPDNRYSAFGIMYGRPFIVDADTMEEVQALRQESKDQIFWSTMEFSNE